VGIASSETKRATADRPSRFHRGPRRTATIVRAVQALPVDHIHLFTVVVDKDDASDAGSRMRASGEFQPPDKLLARVIDRRTETDGGQRKSVMTDIHPYSVARGPCRSGILNREPAV
jgi:hypothetical protein